jgi:hypothetical protein
METKSVSPRVIPYEFAAWRTKQFLASIHEHIPHLPEAILVWSSVLPGLRLPLQAIRHCYAINGVDAQDMCLALTLPGLIGRDAKDWEYRPDNNIILTTNSLLARRLKGRGREVTLRTYTVGLVHSEVMAELQKHSAETLKQFMELMKQGATFRFQKCSIQEALKALSSSKETAEVGYKHGTVTCKSLRVALELVNITGRAPTLLPRHRVQAFGHWKEQ